MATWDWEKLKQNGGMRPVKKKNPNYSPKVTINEDANVQLLGVLYFGVPIVLALLALPIPFFRYVITFGTVILTILMGLALAGLIEDYNNGVKFPRYKRKRKPWPKWVPHVCFAFMVLVSAGLRLGWYLVPVCWVAIWVLFYAFMNHLNDMWIDKPSGPKT